MFYCLSICWLLAVFHFTVTVPFGGRGGLQQSVLCTLFSVLSIEISG